MNRRHFLAATLALGTAPAWLRRAFAAEPSSKALVFDAYRTARRAHRPLLIFVIPADLFERRRRGSAIGAFLAHGTDAQLAPLATCEVVCATAAHVHLLVPKAPAGEPLAVLVDTTAVPATTHAIEVALTDPRAALVGEDGRDELAADRAVQTNIDHIALALRKALGPAAPRLGAAVRARLSERDVPGARWARSSGCGVTYEHPDKSDEGRGMVKCGMGFVPEKSRRFLELLARPPTP